MKECMISHQKTDFPKDWHRQFYKDLDLDWTWTGKRNMVK